MRPRSLTVGWHRWHPDQHPDQYDNALAESVIGLYKTALIRRDAPWRDADSVELRTLEWVDWFNNRRLLETIGYVPPAEFEEAYYRVQEAQERAA